MFNFSKKQQVSSSFLANFLLVNVATLLFFCLPINQLNMQLSGIHQPSISFSFFLLVLVLMLSSWEVSRQAYLRYSPACKQMFKCLFLAVIPVFFIQSNSEHLWQYAASIMLIGLFFLSLEQFSFSRHQHQVFLLLPLLVTWLFSFLLLGFLGFWQGNYSKMLSIMVDLEQSFALLLLTSIPLSAYLLVREQKHKKFGLLSILLLLTPLLVMSSLVLLSNAIYLSLGVLGAFLLQPFLFRYCQRLQQLLWTVFFLVGASQFFFIKGSLQIELFSALEWLNIKETINILIANPISGIGIGQLNNQLLMTKIEQGIDLESYYSSPSWLLRVVTEGGILVALGVLSSFYLLLKTLYRNAKGSRLLFLSMLLPSFYAIIFTQYASINPLLPLLLIMIFYWINDLSAPYQKQQLRSASIHAICNRLILASCVILVSSSIFLSYQALKIDQLTMKQLEQYQKHPWWQSYFKSHYVKRQFYTSYQQKDRLLMTQLVYSQKLLLTKKPDPNGYQELINMAKMAGNMEFAEQNLREAKQLFPSYSFFLE